MSCTSISTHESSVCERESRERIFTSAGVLEHEDLTVYAASPEEGPGVLVATAYMVGGLAMLFGKYVVLPTAI